MTALKFSFRAEELPQKLSQISQEKYTGHWQFTLTDRHRVTNLQLRYLTIVEGQIVFSGTEQLSWSACFKTLRRYLPLLRKSSSQQLLLSLEQELNSRDLEGLGKMLAKMEKKNLLTRQDLVRVLQLQILSDFDNYLFTSSGEAESIANPQLVVPAIITRFKVDEMIALARQRRKSWRFLQTLIPSMESIPRLNPEAIANSSLNIKQKQGLEKLTNRGKTLNQIAYELAKDRLDTAKLFANFIHQGLVFLEISSGNNERAIASGNYPINKPEVFIVDDSPVLVRQFENLVKKWGYKINSSMNPLNAVEQMLSSQPAIIFLDINMPEQSGFELIKQIRRQPQLASIPLVVLTAEQSLSNKYRAKWANSLFLAKPNTPEEIPQFQTDLRTLLLENAPIAI
ncbi:response regulator [Pleurocapsales cyanobacterium LEGE 06147]|nr:response regulator [Pleurocapsales cyanobacterium LEGE 06147]